MVTHRLIEIHRVKNRRVVTGEKLFGDDEDFREFAEFTEILPNRLFGFIVQVILLQLVAVVVVRRHDDGVFGREELIERGFVFVASGRSTATRKVF